MDFFNFNNYVGKITKMLERYHSILVYGKELIGKTTYIKESIKFLGYICGSFSGEDFFGNTSFRIVKIDKTPKKIEKYVVYESTKPIDGFISVKIDYPIQDSKKEFISKFDYLSDDVMKLILNKKLTPFQIVKLVSTNYIEEKFIEIKDEKVLYSPNNRIKILIDNLILRKGKMNLFNQIKVYDKLRFNRNSDKCFFDFFTLKQLRGNKKYGKTTNRKVQTKGNRRNSRK